MKSMVLIHSTDGIKYTHLINTNARKPKYIYQRSCFYTIFEADPVIKTELKLSQIQLKKKCIAFQALTLQFDRFANADRIQEPSKLSLNQPWYSQLTY